MGQRWYILVQDTTPSNDYERQEQTVFMNYFLAYMGVENAAGRGFQME
jgi:hypothetical protein